MWNWDPPPLPPSLSLSFFLSVSLSRAPSLTPALWLTGVSLAQCVCQWGCRLSCAPAYPRCLSPTLSLPLFHSFFLFLSIFSFTHSQAKSFRGSPETSLSNDPMSYAYFHSLLVKRCCVFLSLSLYFLLGGNQDEKDGRHQMGEAGGRRTGVQHQTLQSESVLSFGVYALFFTPVIYLYLFSCLHCRQSVSLSSS